jgi:hypothetical protein
MPETNSTPRRKRDHTGCIGCRLRRKKCSGERPRCTNCVRNCILCTWPEPGNSKHAELLKRTNPTRQRKRSVDTPQTPRRGSSFRTSVSPQCEGDNATSSSELAMVSLALGLPALDVHLLPVKMKSPGSRRLFDYYLHRANKVMAICQGTSNPFVSVLIPMALSNDSILDSLLACSGIHYAHLTGVPADETTWVHYGQAIQAQKFGLTSLVQGRDDVILPLLVTAMLLCIVEVRKMTFSVRSL